MKKISVFDTAGKQIETLSISLALETVPTTAYATSVRRLLQNWRQGTVGCKTRGEVALTGKKPFKQKGTGRARAGTARSPIWRKGGVVFGPQKRVATVSISRKQRQLGLKGAAAHIIESGNLSGLDFGSASDVPSTKAAHTALKNLQLADKKVVLFLSFDDTKNYFSFRNIPNVRVVFYDQLNVFDMTNGTNWLFLKKDTALFNEMVAQWN